MLLCGNRLSLDVCGHNTQILLLSVKMYVVNPDHSKHNVSQLERHRLKNMIVGNRWSLAQIRSPDGLTPPKKTTAVFAKFRADKKFS